MARTSRVWAGLSVVALCAMVPGDTRALHAVPPPALTITRHPEPAHPSAPRTNPEREAARKELADVARNLRQQFLASPDYTQALSVTRDARHDHEEATCAILAQVRASVPYKTGQLELSRAEEKLDRVRQRSPFGSPELISAAQETATARAALTKLESDAILADPDALRAKQNYFDASARVRALVEQFESNIQSDPQKRAARARLDAAR